jgi:hypothetical protein
MTQEDHGAASSADTVTDHETAEDGRADLGVLLVHGIGQSRSGETLVRFGEPLVRWIVDWVGFAASAEVKVVDAVLGVEAEDPTLPAHTRMLVKAPARSSGEQRTSEWMIAESWWAESFVTPTFAEIANWGFRVLPWTVYYHFHRRFLRASSAVRSVWSARPRKYVPLLARSVNLLIELLWLMLALVLAPVLICVLGVLVVLGLVPIPKLRQFVGWLQRGLALTVGDSYSLLGPKIGSAAIYGRVARDLKWLAKRAKKVAVIAHSQGAAVAYRVVSQDDSGRCRLLVTFGAGLRKLAQIRLLDRVTGGWVWLASLALVSFTIALLVSRSKLGVWRGLLLTVLVPAAMFVIPFALGLVLGLVRRVFRRKRKPAKPRSERFQGLVGLALIAATMTAVAWWFPGPSRTTSAWVTLLVALSWGWVVMAFKMAGTEARRIAVMGLPREGRATPETEDPLPESVRWLDFYATRDPVPNGAMFDGEPLDPLGLKFQVEGLESYEVSNRGSSLSDHTTYWKNPEGFVAPMVGALGELCDLDLEGVFSFDRERLVIARHRRRWRVQWLRRARRLITATALLVWLFGDVQTFTVGLFNGALHALRSTPWLGSLLGMALPEKVQATSFTTAMAVAVGAAIAYGLVFTGWIVWESRDRTALLSRSRYAVPTDRRHPALLFHFTWLLSLAAGAIVIFGWTGWPWWAYLLVVTGGLFCAGAFCGVGRFPGGILQTWPSLRKRLGQWTPEVQEEWSRSLRRGPVALIDAATLPDGRPVWRAGVTLVWYPAAPAMTAWIQSETHPTLLEAAQWCVERVDRIEASAGDRAYIPAHCALGGSSDPKRGGEFWDRFFDRPEISTAQRSEAHICRGLCRAKRELWDEAVADFTAVVDMPGAPARDRAIAHNQRAHRYRETGETERALADYAAVVEIPGAPDDERATAHANRGWLAWMDGDVATLYAETLRASKLNPSDFMTGYNLALAELLSGRVESARERYGDLTARCTDAETIRLVRIDIEEALEKRPDLPAAAETIAKLEARGEQLADPPQWQSTLPSPTTRLLEPDP